MAFPSHCLAQFVAAFCAVQYYCLLLFLWRPSHYYLCCLFGQLFAFFSFLCLFPLAHPGRNTVVDEDGDEEEFVAEISEFANLVEFWFSPAPLPAIVFFCILDKVIFQNPFLMIFWLQASLSSFLEMNYCLVVKWMWIVKAAMRRAKRRWEEGKGNWEEGRGWMEKGGETRSINIH